MKFHDALIFLGRDLGLEPFQHSDLDSIRRTLDKYRIDKALLHSYTVRNLEVPYGNDLVFEAAEKDERLIPCPAVLPDAGLEVGAEAASVDSLIQRGARSVCFYPKTFGTSLDRRIIGPLFTALERRRLPVALFEADLLELVPLAEAYPRLPIVVHVPASRARVLLPCLRAAPNIFISIAPNFAPYRGLEVLREQIGDDRILFASSYPAAEPGAPISYLLYSHVPDETVEKVAYGNLDRILTEVRLGDAPAVPLPPAARLGPSPRPARGISDCVWQRRPVPWKGIVDMHAHYGKWAKFPIWGGDADDLVAEMDRIGVEKILVSHHICMSPEVTWGNNQVLDAMRRHPGRILGYACCYPVNDLLGVQEIKRCIAAGMPAIKLHNCNGIPYTDSRLKPVWAYANENRIPVLLHTWGDIDRMESIFSTYRNLPILLGHSGAVRPEMYVDYARKYPHLYLELCTSKSGYGIVEYFVREVGPDRVLFGSDAPWMPIQHQIGRVLFADIPEDAMKVILIENPKRVLSGKAT